MDQYDDLTLFEDRIVAKIAALVGPQIGVSALGDAAGVDRAMKSDPHIFVVLGDDQSSGDSFTAGDTRQMGEIVWKVMLRGRTLREPLGGARKGDRGVYRLSSLVKQGLPGYDPIQNMDDGAYPLRFLSRRPVPNDDEQDTVFQMEMQFKHETADLEE